MYNKKYKILTFIVNEEKELLLLKGSKNDLQLKKSIWYVVTGSYEKQDKDFYNTVKREVKEETGLEVIDMMYLNWIFKYLSLGIKCTEYAYISFVQKKEIILNEENIDYKWYKLDDFLNKIDWFYNKKKLRNVLEKAIEKEMFLKYEQIEGT